MTREVYLLIYQKRARLWYRRAMSLSSGLRDLLELDPLASPPSLDSRLGMLSGPSSSLSCSAMASLTSWTSSSLIKHKSVRRLRKRSCVVLIFAKSNTRQSLPVKREVEEGGDKIITACLGLCSEHRGVVLHRNLWTPR